MVRVAARACGARRLVKERVCASVHARRACVIVDALGNCAQGVRAWNCVNLSLCFVLRFAVADNTRIVSYNGGLVSQRGLRSP